MGGLQALSDEELIEYYNLYKQLSKRDEVLKTTSYDTKFAMNVVRLLYEVEQILTEGDLDLQRNREHLKAIRRGDVKEEEVRIWAAEKEKYLEKKYEESTLPWGPREDDIKTLLLQCLEHHYGNLSNAITLLDAPTKCLTEVREVLTKYGY